MQTKSSELANGRAGAELNGHTPAASDGASPNGHGASLNGHGTSLSGQLDGPDRYVSRPAEPIGELERSLAEIWARVLRVDQVGLDEDFFDLGGHSLLGVELVYEIEEQLARLCTLTMLFRNPTIRALAAEMRAGGSDSTEPLALELASGTGPTVFCICGVHTYQELAEELAPRYSAYGIFLPMEQELLGGGSRATRTLSVEYMASRYLAAVREQQPNGPYLLLGFCFGGILAYEVAQQLKAAGEEVSLLVMLDSTLDSVMPRFKERLAPRVKAHVLRQCEHLPEGLQRRLLGETWVNEAKRLERLRSRIYWQAMQRYRASHYPGPAVLVKPEASAQLFVDHGDATWGWGDRISELVACEVPGSHVTHLKRGNAHIVARVLRPHLDRATQAARRT
jgi:thioesterase domain-containing protein/acyl carrier protein